LTSHFQKWWQQNYLIISSFAECGEAAVSSHNPSPSKLYNGGNPLPQQAGTAQAEQAGD